MISDDVIDLAITKACELVRSRFTDDLAATQELAHQLVATGDRDLIRATMVALATLGGRLATDPGFTPEDAPEALEGLAEYSRFQAIVREFVKGDGE